MCYTEIYIFKKLDQVKIDSFISYIMGLATAFIYIKRFLKDQSHRFRPAPREHFWDIISHVLNKVTLLFCQSVQIVNINNKSCEITSFMVVPND